AIAPGPVPAYAAAIAWIADNTLGVMLVMGGVIWAWLALRRQRRWDLSEQIEQSLQSLASAHPEIIEAQRLQALLESEKRETSKHRTFWTGEANSLTWTLIGTIFGTALGIAISNSDAIFHWLMQQVFGH